MAFEGYSPEIVRYFKELGENNQKDWFDANRERFDRLVIAPSVALISDLGPRLEDLTPRLHAEPKVNGSIRRVYRDTRFSKDKTPYHTHLHLIFWAGGHPNRSPGVHIIIGENGFGAGAGHWALDAAQLKSMRTAILRDGGREFDAICGKLAADGLVLDEPMLKRVPKPYDAAAKGAQFLRHKGFVVKSDRGDMPPEMLSFAGVDYVHALCERLSAFNAYLMRHAYAVED